MTTQPEFRDTEPTDYGGFSDKRYYTSDSMRIGMALVIAGAVVAALAIVVIISSWGGR